MARQQDSSRGGGVPGAWVLRAEVADVVALLPGPEMAAGLLALMRGEKLDPANRADPAAVGDTDADADAAADAARPERLELSAREWVEIAAGWKRVAAFVAAAQLDAVAALDVALQPVPTRRAGVPLPAGRRAADELAPALAIAPQAASRLVMLARRACGPGGDLHRCADALSRGAMDATQLRVVAELTRDLPPQASGTVQDVAVRRAPRATAAALRARLAAEADAADPGHAARAAAVGRSQRDVTLRASPLPGCRRLVADLPTLAAQAGWTAITAVATAARDRGLRGDGTAEDRSLAQLRADALTAAVTGRADPADPTLVAGPEALAGLAEVQVVITAEALLAGGPIDPPPGPGSDPGGAGPGGSGSGGGGPGGGGPGGGWGSGGGSGDADPRARRAALPATIPGAGILDAAETRRIAATTRWRRLLVDAATGTLHAYGRRTHPPPRQPDPHQRQPDPRQRQPDPRQRQPDPRQSAASPGDVDLRGDPRWHALRTDPIEAPPPPGTGYRPPAALRRHVHTRDATCAGPACFHTARGTQLDHTTAWTGGRTRTRRGGAGGATAGTTAGATTAGNLASLCRRAHNAKTHGGWTLTQPAPGDLTWTSPTGRTYHRRARPLVTGWPVGVT